MVRSLPSSLVLTLCLSALPGCSGCGNETSAVADADPSVAPASSLGPNAASSSVVLGPRATARPSSMPAASVFRAPIPHGSASQAP